MRTFLLITSFFFVCNTVFSQVSNVLSADEILNKRGEVYFSFYADSSEIQAFTNMISLDSHKGNQFFAYANRAEFEKFLMTNKRYSIVEDYYNKNLRSIDMASSVAEMSNWDKYPTYEVYIQMMEAFAADYPEICKLDTIGYSGDGRLLLAVKISDNVEIAEAEPEFLYTGLMHGDELVAGILFLRMIDYLLTEYATNDEVADIVNETQIYINPFANPDGTYYGGNDDVSDSRRYNAADIDLNRNYRDFIAGENPDGGVYGVETVAFMDYATERNFVMSANSHSGAELLNYPYDTESILPSDDDWWNFVCLEYADMVHDNSPSGYFDDEGNGVTNGYAWYTVTGSRQDYMNYFHYCREVTVELSTAKLLDANLLPDHWDYNRQAMLNYLKQVNYGLRGIVTDSVTHEPLEAMILIDGFDFLNSHVYSFSEFGDYYRLLYEGDYAVTYSCEGYKSKTFDVSINNYEQTIKDVELVNLDMLPPSVDFISNSQSVDCSSGIEFENLSEASESTSYLWDFGDGETSVEENPIHHYYQNGDYTIKLFAENEHGQDSLVKSEYIHVNLSQLDISDYVICASEGSVVAEVSGVGDIYWYHNINDETEFNVGDTYTTPTLTETTVYYVQDFIAGEQAVGGEPDNSEGGDYVADNNYLVFDCLQECILVSVNVYANGSANRTIYIKDENGNMIFNQEIYIEDGLQTVELNVNLPVVNNIKIGANAGCELYRGNINLWTNFDYPYNIGSYVSIKKNNEVLWNDEKKYYSYFYNWVVKEEDCYSEREELFVYVNETTNADFDFLANLNTVSFENTSVSADSYSWDFDDGSYSTEMNPVHLYSEVGTYNVKLISSSDCGSDEVIKEVVVGTGIDTQIQNDLSVFPNPMSEYVVVKSEYSIRRIQILNIYGQLVYNEFLNSNTVEINTKDFSEGVYFLKVYSDNYYEYLKIIKN